ARRLEPTRVFSGPATAECAENFCGAGGIVCVVGAAKSAFIIRLCQSIGVVQIAVECDGWRDVCVEFEVCLKMRCAVFFIANAGDVKAVGLTRGDTARPAEIVLTILQKG